MMELFDPMGICFAAINYLIGYAWCYHLHVRRAKKER